VARTENKVHKSGPLKGLKKLSPATYVWRGSGIFSVFSNFLWPSKREFGPRELAKERWERMRPMRECLQKNKNLCKYLELDKERLKLQQKSFDRPKDIGLKLKIFYLSMRIKTLL
jgi:hypothetical protein